jgi:hypothetical protein
MIKGITSIYRPQRQGKIHLGIKKQSSSGKDYPAEVDYFVLKDAPEVAEHYPDKPKELHVMLPSSRFEKNFADYLERVFPQNLKRYRASGLMCKGDGEAAVCVNVESGELEERPCPCEFLESGECKRIGIFRFRIQEIPTFNIYQITTSSFNSIVNINSFIRDLAEHCMVSGIDISSVKLALRREEQEVQRLEKGKTTKSKHHIMILDLDRRHYKSIEDVRRLALPQAQAKPKALPPPAEDRDDLFFPTDAEAGAGDEAEPTEQNEATDDDFPNGHDPLDDAVRAGDPGSEGGFENIEVALEDGSKKMVDKFAALRLFQDMKKRIGDAMYYATLETAGYKKSNAVPPEDIPRVYALMLQCAKLKAKPKADSASGDVKDDFQKKMSRLLDLLEDFKSLGGQIRKGEDLTAYEDVSDVDEAIDYYSAMRDIYKLLDEHREAGGFVSPEKMSKIVSIKTAADARAALAKYKAAKGKKG